MEKDKDCLVEVWVVGGGFVVCVDGPQCRPKDVHGPVACPLPGGVRNAVGARSRGTGNFDGPNEILFPGGPFLWVCFARWAFLLVGGLKPSFEVWTVGFFVVKCARPVVA